MPTESPAKPFINIDDLRTGVTAEKILAYHGVPIPECKNRPNGEIRMPCPIACEQGETGGYRRVVSIQGNTRGFAWKCFGCPKQLGGNDISFDDLVRDDKGTGKPRGERFKEVLADFTQMAGGIEHRPVAEGPVPIPPQSASPKTPQDVAANQPLSESENEKARALVDLAAKFETDWSRLPPVVASYFRKREWAKDLENLVAEWGIGYLHRDTNGDRSGGTLRGRICAPIRNESGEILAWCGRDAEYEVKLAHHLSLPEAKKSESEPPAKWKFPAASVFRKGLELFGQERIAKATKKALRQQGGIVVVEGIGDVVNLARAKITAVAILGTVPTNEQIEKIVAYAKEVDDRLLLMGDLDEEGRHGMLRTFTKLAPRAYLKTVWTSETEAGRFLNRDPGGLTIEEIERLFAPLRRKTR